MGDERPDAAAIDLATLAAEHGVALTRFAYILSGNRSSADDLVQETYLKLYRRSVKVCRSPLRWRTPAARW